MKKKLTCIECPAGCTLTAYIEDDKVVKLEGGKCPKGESYAISEVENPRRIFTSTVRAKGLSVKMIPVRTVAPIPKALIFQMMREIKKIVVTGPVEVGTVIIKDLLDTGTDLVSTRAVQ
ncbi:MAG: DUF1667 domain-containing protein [Candidatus Omnitrophica bacterium]|nr:DUF1667 domain-containing protein [Candidatus Omnitrophota bacterium]